MSNKLYDVLKWVALLFIPALATLLTVLGDIWDISIMANISATVSAIGLFIGACIGISTKQYYSEIPTDKQANAFETTDPESPNEEV